MSSIFSFCQNRKKIFFTLGEGRVFRLPKRHSSRKAAVSSMQCKQHCSANGGKLREGLSAVKFVSFFLLLMSLSASFAVSAERKYSVNIAQQKLSQALTQLSVQTDMQIIFPFELIEGKTASAVAMGRHKSKAK